ncbi:MAG: UDPGP type 1 family protein [Verrucomicrobia bacterium]|nr:MAG: UDPGP type 1 family protein [Verrucomicrobiota bacterium]
MDSEHSVIQRFKNNGQGHVFGFWDELGDGERSNLLAQTEEIGLGEITHLYETLIRNPGDSLIDMSELKPAPFIKLEKSPGEEVIWTEAKLAGEEALRSGEVAAFTVAGGQGTRLGFDGPKGTFPVTPVLRHSLFQVFAEKLRAAEANYHCLIPWFIMTSHANHEAIEAFFSDHGFFGLKPEQVHFFRQGRMPAVDHDGRILLESKSSVAMSPDGHGGSLRALVRSGAIDTMEKAGIKVISYFQVDNPLVHCVDAAFIGFHLLRGSEMSSRMIPKAYSDEKLGHFCYENGKLVVIEYSDMPTALISRMDADGQLTFRAGSIAIHVLSTAFARRLGDGGSGIVLPFHRADKKVVTIDEDGNSVAPGAANGIKFEMFVFDALPFAKNPIVVETSRIDEFSPVKNAEGVDSPRTCQEDQLRQIARWLHVAGVSIETDETGLPSIGIEVSPLFGYDEDTFVRSWQMLDPKPRIVDGLVLK